MQYHGKVRGCAFEAVWEQRLVSRDVIRLQATQKTLELSDVILQKFHVATHTSPDWALQALANNISNATTERFNLCKKLDDLWAQ